MICYSSVKVSFPKKMAFLGDSKHVFVSLKDMGTKQAGVINQALTGVITPPDLSRPLALSP
jgi:hypothetical protein